MTTEPLAKEGNTTVTMCEGLADGAGERALAGLRASAKEFGRGVFRLGDFGELVAEPTEGRLRLADKHFKPLPNLPALPVTGYRYTLYRFQQADGETITEGQVLRLLEVHKRRVVTEAIVDLALALEAAIEGGAK